MKTLRIVALLAFISLAGVSVSQAGNPYYGYRHCHPHCRPVVYGGYIPAPAFYAPPIAVVPMMPYGGVYGHPYYRCHPHPHPRGNYYYGRRR